MNEIELPKIPRDAMNKMQAAGAEKWLQSIALIKCSNGQAAEIEVQDGKLVFKNIREWTPTDEEYAKGQQTLLSRPTR